MKLHWIQHVPFEGLGYIEQIALKKGYEISVTRVYEEGFSFPPVEEFDLLVIMGGPMGVYETEKYTWLLEEKSFIKYAIGRGKIVLGICLGAQLLAEALGATVYKNGEKEIGWYRLIEETDYQGKLSGIFSGNPEVFHWHGDTFILPEGSKRICKTEGCLNQGFDYNGQVFGLQFHLETTKQSAIDLIKYCGDELLERGRYVQNEYQILADTKNFEIINRIMERLFLKITG